MQDLPSPLDPYLDPEIPRATVPNSLPLDRRVEPPVSFATEMMFKAQTPPWNADRNVSADAMTPPAPRRYVRKKAVAAPVSAAPMMASQVPISIPSPFSSSSTSASVMDSLYDEVDREVDDKVRTEAEVAAREREEKRRVFLQRNPQWYGYESPPSYVRDEYERATSPSSDLLRDDNDDDEEDEKDPEERVPIEDGESRDDAQDRKHSAVPEKKNQSRYAPYACANAGQRFTTSRFYRREVQKIMAKPGRSRAQRMQELDQLRRRIAESVIKERARCLREKKLLRPGQTPLPFSIFTSITQDSKVIEEKTKCRAVRLRAQGKAAIVKYTRNRDAIGRVQDANGNPLFIKGVQSAFLARRDLYFMRALQNILVDGQYMVPRLEGRWKCSYPSVIKDMHSVMFPTDQLRSRQPLDGTMSPGSQFDTWYPGLAATWYFLLMEEYQGNFRNLLLNSNVVTNAATGRGELPPREQWVPIQFLRFVEKRWCLRISG
jgi:hypothetical protein